MHVSEHTLSHGHVSVFTVHHPQHYYCSNHYMVQLCTFVYTEALYRHGLETLEMSFVQINCNVILEVQGPSLDT
jgi:hypothetical protein